MTRRGLLLALAVPAVVAGAIAIPHPADFVKTSHDVGARPPGGPDELTTEQKLRGQLRAERRKHARILRTTRRDARRWRTAARRSPSVTEAIRLAAFTHGVSESTMRRIAFCESRLNPRARNRSSAASGLLQFLPSTWRGNRYGRAGFSVWSPYANAMGAAYHMSRYGTGAWECR